MGSPSYHYADHLLAGQGGIDVWVAARRETGLSWRLIARELRLATHGRIDITHETLRSWYAPAGENGEAA